MLNEDKKYGVKLTIINQLDYLDYQEICGAVLELGYEAQVVDNGVTVFQKNRG